MHPLHEKLQSKQTMSCEKLCTGLCGDQLVPRLNPGSGCKCCRDQSIRHMFRLVVYILCNCSLTVMGLSLPVLWVGVRRIDKMHVPVLWVGVRRTDKMHVPGARWNRADEMEHTDETENGETH